MATDLARPPLGGPQDAFYAVGQTVGMPRIVRGEGYRLFDDAGRELIDAASGTFVANLGQGDEHVLAAMHEQGRRLTFSYVKNTRHDANLDLTARLARLSGPGLERVHLSCDGSEAVEMAIKLLRQRAVALGQTERTRVISLLPSYHGATLGAIALNGDLDAEAVYGPMVTFSRKIPAPLTYRAESPEAAARASLDALRDAIAELGPERVLALVVEPVGGQSTGANVPHPSFLDGARRLLDEAGAALVYDEVLCSVRTGSFLAWRGIGAPQPDLVVMAKGIGAGYAPLGAVLAPAAMVDDLAHRTGFNLTHTYNANPIACAAGIAVLDRVVELDLVGRAAALGPHLRAGLERMAATRPIVGDVRGKGLLLGVEVVADRATARPFPEDVDPADRLRVAALRHGLLLYARRQNRGRFGDWVVIAPPLVIDEAGCDELVDRLGRALDDVAAELLP